MKTQNPSGLRTHPHKPTVMTLIQATRKGKPWHGAKLIIGTHEATLELGNARLTFYLPQPL